MNNSKDLMRLLAITLITLEFLKAIKYTEGEEQLLSIITVLLTFAVFQLKG